jgi:LmbE family N-acetylglucosaminyl deacetylase
MSETSRPRLLVLGAHPDDAEFHAGGLIAAYCQQDCPVKIISVTNGGSGHHACGSAELVERRRAEAAEVGRLLGAEYEVWEFPDGSLLPTLDVRAQVIREIRTFRPDLVLTHRLNDYHPDHRAVGQVVQDASYLVTVPLVVPETEALRVDPVVAYMTDFFTRPAPLRPDIVIDIGEYFLTVVDMLHCHRSQVYEWLPYNRGREEVPESEAAQKEWLAKWFAERSRAVADCFRSVLCEHFGSEPGNKIEFAEAYEISEYAADLGEADRCRLFRLA